MTIPDFVGTEVDRYSAIKVTAQRTDRAFGGCFQWRGATQVETRATRWHHANGGVYSSTSASSAATSCIGDDTIAASAASRAHVRAPSAIFRPRASSAGQHFCTA